MSILINKDTRLLVQGITGHEGMFHTQQMVSYGTRIVAGVRPGKGGEWALDGKIPKFASVKAAIAYDQAFALYRTIPEKERPWRMMWYQTGPYWAYCYTGRYQDVINLATKTLDAMSEPVLEESYYWRALARGASGDNKGAIQDLRSSLEYHPGFEPSLAQLEQLNAAP